MAELLDMGKGGTLSFASHISFLYLWNACFLDCFRNYGETLMEIENNITVYYPL